MAKFKFTVSLGDAKTDREGIVEIEDEELAGKRDEDRETVIEFHLRMWAEDRVECSWEEL